MNQLKKTKIIATISDINCNEEKLIALYNAGTNIVRFNFSHAQHESVAKLLQNIKELNASWKTNLSTLLDTKWPEIRTGVVQEKIELFPATTMQDFSFEYRSSTSTYAIRIKLKGDKPIDEKLGETIRKILEEKLNRRVAVYVDMKVEPPENRNKISN